MVIPAVGRWWQRWLAAALIIVAVLYYCGVGKGSFRSNAIRYDSSGNPIQPVREGSRVPASNAGAKGEGSRKDDTRPGGAPVPEQPLAPAPVIPNTASQAEMGVLPISNKPSGFIEAAHQLRHADDFLPHIRAVTALPALSMADAPRTCHWTHEDRVNFQFIADTEWVTHPKTDQWVAEHRRSWHDYVLHDMIPYASAASRFENGGRGIVVVAGDGVSFKRLRVLLRALLDLRTALPVEIQYFENEMSEAQRAELRRIFGNVSFLDLSAPGHTVNVTASLFLNYNFKTAALINSQFAEPLLLDSDNVPAQDPSLLYDAPTYHEYGTVFWPDIARTRPVNPMWAVTDTPCRPDEYEQESGQLLVDKRRFFYHLQLAAWFIDQHAYNDFLLGDKDMFRFAWHALKTRYGRPRRWVTSVGFAVDEADPAAPRGRRKVFCGHSFAQHDPDSGAVAFVHMGLAKTLDYVAVSRLRAAGGLFQAYKRSPRDEDKTYAERVGIKYWSAGAYVASTPGPDPAEVLDEEHRTRVSQCTDMFDVEYKGLGLVADGFEGLYERSGGYWIVDEKYDWGQGVGL